MLYIIGAVILLVICFMIGGENGCGLFLFLIIGLILWKTGLLGLILRGVMWVAQILFRIFGRVLEWILQKVVLYGAKIWDFFDENVFNLILIGM
ncbi:hypothetical protein JNUCC23_23220 (plasmid) [Peribacillus sp. JNUCC 23]